jgi:hypothetical protein
LCMAKYEQGASLVHSSSLMWCLFYWTKAVIRDALAACLPSKRPSSSPASAIVS